MAIGLPNNAYVQRQSEEKVVVQPSQKRVEMEKVKQTTSEKSISSEQNDRLNKEVGKYTASLIERFLTFITQLFITLFSAKA